MIDIVHYLSFMPSSKPAQSILSVILDDEYPVSLHSLFEMIGTVTSCRVFETSPLKFNFEMKNEQLRRRNDKFTLP